MKRIFIVFCLLTLIFPSWSQTTFEVSIGNKNSNQWGYDIVESYDDGFVIVGRTDEDGVDDILFLKIDSEGNVVENRNIGGANVNDYAKSLCRASNNKYAVCGMTRGYAKLDAGEGEDAFFVQIDQNMKNIKLPIPFGDEGEEIANSIVHLNDGNFIISIDKKSLVGFEYRHDCFLVKLNPDGNQIWIKDFTDIGETWGNDLLQAKDGNIYLAGTVKNKLGNDRDIFVCKISPSGTIVWEKTIYAKVNHNESSQAITQDKDGNLILTGKKISPKQSYPLLMKISPDGEKLMEEYYDVGYDAGGNDIIQFNNNELIMVGSDYGHKGFVLHLDLKGKIIEQYLFTPSISKIIKSKDDNGFALLGEELLESKFRNIFLKKTNLFELKDRNKSIEDDIRQRSKKLFYGELPAHTKEPILILIDNAIAKYAEEKAAEDFNGDIKIKIKGAISVKLDSTGKAIESNVELDESSDNNSINIIEYLNHEKLLDLTYEPATWKGYKVQVLYQATLSEYYTISQYNVKIKNGLITKIRYSDDQYFLDYTSFREQFLKLIKEDKRFKGDGKYHILYYTQLSDYLSPTNPKILKLHFL
jgi:hypothetical protein